ncbi:MAG: hypothetical protein KGZ91_21135 [Afipia sp.]|nr:hypothetical protein [Afipia sp.]
MQAEARAQYLVLHNLSEAKRSVEILPDLSTALLGWGVGTRLSPIWRLRGDNKSAPPVSKFTGASDLIFLGPVRVARLSSEVRALADPDKISIWVTMGCFNVVVRSPNSKITAEIKTWAETEKVPFEIWHLKGTKIAAVAHTVFSNSDLQATMSELATIGKLTVDAALRVTLQEHLAVTATVLARSAAIYPLAYSDFRSTLTVTKALVQAAERSELHTLSLQSRLVSANAAISRFSSQAFSGIPPILSTECHFWIHSLLGTGSANIALARLVGWVQKILGEADLPERISNLERQTENVPTLAELTENPNYLERDPLSEKITKSDSPPVPLITYFSGRDGFSSHLQTLSAPLTAIAECNSYRSNLLTVTHEIAHILVAVLMTDLYPDFNDSQQLEMAAEIARSRFKSRNWLEAAKQLLLEGVIGMSQAETGVEVRQSELKERLPEILRDCRREAQEIIVHTLDFWYFYRSDPDFYVKSIWHSWCTIPEIQDRVPEYLMRTLCAVSVTLLRETPENRFPAALRDIKRILGALRAEGGATRDYIAVALDYIQQLECDAEYRRVFEQQYSARLLLVRMVVIFMTSEQLSAQLYADAYEGGGSGYERKPTLSYDLIPVGNPLTFFRAHLKDDPGEGESLWVLHSLAFDLMADG